MNDPTTRPETWTVWTHTDEEYKHELGAYSAGASMDDRITSDAIRELLDARAELSLALELLEKADYAIGYVLDVRELKCMHPGRAVDDCCAVCLINKWRVRLDASGLLGEIGG